MTLPFTSLGGAAPAPSGLPRVISKDEVRVGDKVRLTFEGKGVVTDQTLTVLKVNNDIDAIYYGPSPFAYLISNTADTITLLERPKPQFKVGDRVRRENKTGVTVEFTIHRIDEDRIYPQYAGDDLSYPGVGYNPERFELVQ